MAKLFDKVRYALSNTLGDESCMQLSTLLDANGAAPALPSDERLTHYISKTLPASQPIDELPEESDAHIVTPLWVERSVIMASRQDESGFSPDPSLIFSGVVATACDLSYADLDVLSAGISALGGLWRSALTKEVTHLFALSTGSAKYETGIQFKDDMGLTVVVPHWFDDCVRVGQLIDPGPYEWPEPKVFEATWGTEIENTINSKSRSPQKLPPEKEAVYASVFQNGPPPTPKGVWKGFKLMLSLDMTNSQIVAHEADILREGGIVVHDVEKADILIMRYRSGPTFVQAYRMNKTIGTLAWLWFVRATGKISRPTDQLLHYPIPYRPIDGFSEHRVTITNYTGTDREYLKKLVLLLGAKFTADMTGNNTVVIAASMDGKKTQKAISWSIPVVNHMWLEDCFIQWRHISQTRDKYTYFPPGVDFGKLLGRKGLGRGGYDPSELELIENEVIAEEKGETPESNGHSEPFATGESARDVEDVVMADAGDMSLGAYDIQMGVNGDDGEVAAPRSGAGTSSSEAKASYKLKDTSKNKPASQPPATRPAPIEASEVDRSQASPRTSTRHRLSVESEDEIEHDPPAVEPRTRRASGSNQKAQRAVESAEEEKLASSPPKTRSNTKQRQKAAPQDDDEMQDADKSPQLKPAIRHTYGSSAKRSRAVTVPDHGDTPPPSPSKPSLRTPKRTVSVLLPTYEQVKSASKNSPFKPTRIGSPQAQAHDPGSGSPKRGHILKGREDKAGPSTRSAVSSPSPPPSTKRTRVTNNAHRPVTPAGHHETTSTPVTSNRTPSRRSAATKATQRLREEVMPDVLNFQKELKRGNIRSSWDHGQASTKKAKENAKGKKRSSVGDGEDEETVDEQEQPDKKRRRSSTGTKASAKGKGKVDALSSDEEEENDKVIEESPQLPKRRPKDAAAHDKSSGRISKKDPGNITIMTTQVSLPEDVHKSMTQLGVKFTTKSSECTHLVTRNIVRTEKFLCAMAVGPIIVTDKWVQMSALKKRLLVEDDFLLQDPQSEKKYGFELADALERARTHKGKLFAGITFLLTPKVPIDTKLLKNVVISGGGQVVTGSSPTQRMLKSKNKYVVSCLADISIWRSLAEQNFPIYSQELILNSALKQEIDWDHPSNKVDGSY